MKTVCDRTQMLLGREGITRLKEKKVLIFGIGGVGGFVAEALARTGVGTIGIVDYDSVDITNINRQIIALHSTIGRLKTQVMKERINDINPCLKVQTFEERLTILNIEEFNLANWDYIVDAIDDVPAKLLLIREAKTLKIPIICSMGAGNHFNPNSFQVSDIKKTHNCPLAKIIRKEVGKMGIIDLKVVFSTELPRREEYPENGSHCPASIVFAPAAAGLIIAAEIVKDLMDGK